MSYRIDDPTGRVVGELLSSMIEPPRLAVGDQGSSSGSTLVPELT